VPCYTTNWRLAHGVALAKSPDEPLFLPPGSEHVAGWARQRRVRLQALPEDEWFRAWEPFDTMVSASKYYNSVSWPIAGGSVTVAEPWIAPVGSEPLDRTLITFVSHPVFSRWASARGGEHFNTRVSFIESAPPPSVSLGDPSWDQYMATFAASAAEAAAAFPVPARQKLRAWGFSGHIEVRPGGLVFHFAGFRPSPESLERLYRGVPELVQAFSGQ
jgi:hypothetical protein